MIFIEMDGYFQQAIIYGKYCSLNELQQMYAQVLQETTTMKEEIEVFCTLHQFNIVASTKERKVHYVIDMDIKHIYISIYEAE